MSKLLLVDFKKFEKLLYKLSFARSRQKGSHVVFHHEDGRTLSVPDHGSKDLSRKLIRRLIKQINVEVDDYINLLD